MITVVGSLNLDYVVRVEHHPKLGETVLGSDVELHPGGKGANQAIAAARAGAGVQMIGCVGTDPAASVLQANLERAGVLTSHLLARDGASGAAFITVNPSGQNSIVVAPGSNHRLLTTDLQATFFEQTSVLLLQLEIPWATSLTAAQLARQRGAKVVLNLAPAQKLEAADLAHISTLVVNETEASILLGRAPQNVKEALLEVAALLELVPEAIITLGANGAVYGNQNGTGHVPSFAVQVIDTTAAGDAFIGALAAALAKQSSLEVAVQRAVAAGALACTRVGAQPSLPSEAEIDALLRQ